MANSNYKVIVVGLLPNIQFAKKLARTLYSFIPPPGQRSKATASTILEVGLNGRK
jgi:hypothetical protein